MIRRDFILRIIEEFGNFWAQFVHQLQGKQVLVARATIDRAYQHILGLDPATARTLSVGELLVRVQFGEFPEAALERCFVLSALLKADGDLATEEDQPNLAASFFQRSLAVVLHVAAKFPDAKPHEFVPSVSQLVGALQEYTLPPDLLRPLFAYYEQQGDYAKAEDTLFELAEHTGGPAFRALGEAFYTRLEALDDTLLEAGGLSRAEVGAGWQALQTAQRD